MAKREYNLDLDIKGSISATTVPNSTGSVVTWNSSTNVFGLRSNSQILSDLGLTSVVSNSHTHTNKSILDGITSVKVSNWDTAYGWGDFRQYGLGIKSDHNSDANDSRLWDNGFYTLGASSINRPLYVSNSYASGILTISETTTRRVQIATGGNQTGRLAFRSITNSTQGDWLEFWHSGNLTNVSQLNNDAGYLTNSTAKYIAIGNGSQTGVGNGNAENLRNGSVWSTPTTGGIPSSNGAVVSFNPYSNGNYGFQLGARSNKFYGRTLENGTLNNWVQFWHEGNFSQTNINNWNTAFGWGRGIKIDGNSEGVHNLLSLDANLIKNSSVWVNSGSANIPNYGPSKGAPIVNFTPYKSGATEYGFSISARENRILFNTKEASVVGDWLELYHSGNFNPSDYALVSQLTGYVPTSRTITAGNGLSGGGSLAANRTITLGTPTAITLSSTNSVTTSSHTHAFTPGGTTAQYIRGDGTLATLPTFTDAITSISRDGVNIPISNKNVDIPIFSTSGAGLVPPRVGSVATKYLREDGTWVTPTNTTYSAGTLALLQAGTNTTNRIWSAKILADYVTSMIPTTSDGILSYSSANGIIVTDWNSFALSEYAMSLGYGSVTSGNYATSVGGLLSTTGFGSTNQGYSNSITKSLGYALGAYNSVRATLSGAFGIGLINRNDGAFVVGRYNSELPIEPYDTTSPHKQAVFAIGAGRDDTDRYTAVTVYGDGRADYAEGYDDSNWTNNTLVTKKWVLDNAGGSSGGGGVAYRNVISGTFDLSSEYGPSLAESVFNVRGGSPIVFIGGDAVFHDGYKVTIMTNDNRVNVSLDSSREVKFIDAEDIAVSYVEDYTSITFIYDKEYSSFRVYHKSFISLN